MGYLFTISTGKISPDLWTVNGTYPSHLEFLTNQGSNSVQVHTNIQSNAAISCEKRFPSTTPRFQVLTPKIWQSPIGSKDHKLVVKQISNLYIYIYTKPRDQQDLVSNVHIRSICCDAISWIKTNKLLQIPQPTFFLGGVEGHILEVTIPKNHTTYTDFTSTTRWPPYDHYLNGRK